MPRRRGLDQSTFFHVWNRGADRQDIFTVDGDQAFFEGLFADVVDATGAAIHAYALMTNHYHTLVEAAGRQLSEVMYRVGRGYATWYNHQTRRTGPLCDGRFGSQPITDTEMLMVEARYVHRNPADIVGLDALVNYRFSSLGVYAGRRTAPPWLTTDRLGPLFASPEAHVDFVRRTHPTDTQYSGRRPPLNLIDLDGLDTAVAFSAGIAPNALAIGRRGQRNDPRLVALMLAMEMRLASQAELAARYGYESARSGRNAAAAGRARLARDPVLHGLRLRVLDVLGRRDRPRSAA